MRSHLTRRDILKLLGGSSVGFFLTPVPWKLLDDTAIWTQNWSMIPPLPRGERTERYSACTICPGGCAVKAKCVGGIPYALSGVPGHPTGRGFLCPVGLAGHQMVHHPLRLTSPVRFEGAGESARMVPISNDAAMSAAAAKIGERGGSVVVLDCRPGRAVSAHYQDLAEMVGDGLYVTAPSREDATLAALASMMEDESSPLGFDLERADMILSFGAPLLDGWGSPGRMRRLVGDRTSRRGRVVQIESRQSRTALQADAWLPVKPGGVYALALSLGHVLLEEHLDRETLGRRVTDLAAYRARVAPYTPEAAYQETGIDPSIVRRTAGELAHAQAPIILSGADPGGGPVDHASEHAVAGLNLLLGALGAKGGLVFRHPMPGLAHWSAPVRDLRDVPDRSVRLLIVDAASSGYSLPWAMLERKLCPGTGMVVAVAASLNDIAAHADIVVPTPAPYESLQDVPNDPGAARASFGLSIPLFPSQAQSVDPAAFVAGVASRAGFPLRAPEADLLLKERARAIHGERRGAVSQRSGGASVRVSEIATPDEFWTRLTEGGVWIDDDRDAHAPATATLATFIERPTEMAAPGADGLVLMPYGWKCAVSGADVSPLLSKLYQESALRPGPGSISLHPSTAALSGVGHGDRVAVETSRGAMEVTVRVDRSVRPGIAEGAAGPSPLEPGRSGRDVVDILDLCEVRDDGTWRMTNANVRKV